MFLAFSCKNITLFSQAFRAHVPLPPPLTDLIYYQRPTYLAQVGGIIGWAMLASQLHPIYQWLFACSSILCTVGPCTFSLMHSMIAPRALLLVLPLFFPLSLNFSLLFSC
jgi:hypothetical protein